MDYHRRLGEQISICSRQLATGAVALLPLEAAPFRIEPLFVDRALSSVDRRSLAQDLRARPCLPSIVASRVAALFPCAIRPR